MNAVLAFLCVTSMPLGSPQAAAPKTPQVAPAPAITAGADPAFINSIFRIETALSDQEFDQAATLAKSLPVRKITIEWDDKKVPVDLRQAYFDQLHSAVVEWEQGIPMSIQVFSTTDPMFPRGKEKPEIKFDFENKLAPSPSQNEPQAAALFTGDGSQPLEAVIGLHRGNPLKASTALEVGNDVRYAIGKYLGVADSPVPGSFLFHVNGATTYPAHGIPPDHVRAAGNLDVVDAIRDAIEKKQTMKPVSPQASVSPAAITVTKDVVQGDVLSMMFQVTNTGTGVLNAELLPDCSCFSIPDPLRLGASQTGLFKLNMDTSPYSAGTHKVLYVFTNDANNPLIQIPVDVSIAPRYVFSILGGSEQPVSENGGTVKATLKFHDPDVKVLGWTVDPKGYLAEMTSPSDAKGKFSFSIKVPKGVKNKRVQVTLNVSSTDVKFPSVHQTFYVQNGIIASPNPAFLGSISQVGTPFVISLTNPGHAFRVLGAKSTSPYFSVETSGSGPGDRHRVTLKCTGLGIPGSFKGTIKVKTSDPAQPTLDIPFEGSFS